MFVGHVVVAGLVLTLDVRWIRSEMEAPGWDGLPDMDAIFYIGVVVRVFLVNAALLPIAFLAMYFASSKSRIHV